MNIATSHIISIGNETASLAVDLYGGAIVDFHLHDGDINPFTFKLSPEDMPEHNRSGASYRGHFICLGRWGPPTEGEIKAGIPDHGQAANLMWKQKHQSSPLERGRAASAAAGVCSTSSIQMSVTTPLEGLKIERTIQLDNANAVFKVNEQITNINPLSRLYNVVQHPTLAKPYLTQNTIVNCNADTGFNYMMSARPLEHTAKWPYGTMEDGGTMNVSKPDKAYSSVFSYTIKKDAKFGWITAYTPEINLLTGYLWRRETYPWISLWQDFDNAAIRYRGLEFGTTGMHKSYKQIIEESNHEVFGERSYLLIDAGELQQKSYLGFMLKTPDGFSEIADVNLTDSSISIKSTDGNELNIQTTLSV
jgi:hypothetical protein